MTGGTKMKEKIHPKYFKTTAHCACGATYEIGSTQQNIRVDICSACHPLFTGKQKLLDTAGRVEKFRRKYEKAAERKKKLEEAKRKIEEAKKKTEEKKKMTEEEMIAEKLKAAEVKGKKKKAKVKAKPKKKAKAKPPKAAKKTKKKSK